MADYFKSMLEPVGRNHCIDAIYQRLLDVDFDTIVCTGVSGVSAGSILAFLLDKRLLVIRKENDDSHHGNRPSGWLSPNTSKVVIVDDFVCSGRTMKRIDEKLENLYDGAIYIVGVALYEAFISSDEDKSHSVAREVVDEVFSEQTPIFYGYDNYSDTLDNALNYFTDNE